MQVRIINNINQIDAEDWNHLATQQNPFLRHEFLTALERHGCVGQRHGWLPHHISIRDDKGRLIGACPLYLKDNSYGEFVFDWGWADAYHRHGLEYYPKLVSAIPYTPATGPRLLVAEREGEEQAESDIAAMLIKTAVSLAEQNHFSSLHWLFTNERDTDHLKQHQFQLRLGYQFHWHNHNYQNFDDFLATLKSQKRKQIKRERRTVADADIELKILHGHEMTEELWQIFHHHYESTFDKLGGYASLSLPFFQEIGQTMADNVVVVFAFESGRPVASAFCIRGGDTLYGRHWGCDKDFNNLHFEACYYQGIEYCIKHGLQRFEPGAQGEHKISRGFLPTPTWSGHWIAETQFRQAITEFLQHETISIQRYIHQLLRHSPYKQNDKQYDK